MQSYSPCVEQRLSLEGRFGSNELQLIWNKKEVIGAVKAVNHRYLEGNSRFNTSIFINPQLVRSSLCTENHSNAQTNKYTKEPAE